MEMKYFESQPYFSRKNLEIILGSNRRTVDARIKKLIDNNVLLRLRKGFYLSVPYYERSNNKKGFLEYIGSILVYPSYVSLEYAMSSYNLLAESVYSITYVTTKKTRKIATPIINLTYKSIKEKLFFGTTTRFFENKEYQFATPAKAIYDFFYFIQFVSDEQLEQYILIDSRINWDVLTINDKKEFKQIVKRLNSPKMNRVLNILVKNQIL